ncbi:MAG: CDP-alcohol phosphatidyltransferase family protein [Spirochaetes bacterium]|nr:CDP-alcohol phosphatidyltransferase family protein [Spirochaetota bacterium]
MKKLLEIYKKSLKPLIIEELADVYVFRVLGFMIAYPLRKTRISPNYITILSGLTGIMTGLFYARGDYSGLVLGTLFLIITNVFDCADGQLARLTQRTSRMGKTLDGFVDFITYHAVFLGIAYHLYIRYWFPWTIFIYAFISIWVMFLHIFYFDHFKNEYISYCLPDYNEKSEDVEKLKQRFKKKKEEGFIPGTLAFFYLGFYTIQYFVTQFAYPSDYRGYTTEYGEKKKPTAKAIRKYDKEMRRFVRLWTFFGATSHLTVIKLLALFNLPQYILHINSIFYTLALIVLVIYQRRSLVRIKKIISAR